MGLQPVAHQVVVNGTQLHLQIMSIPLKFYNNLDG